MCSSESAFDFKQSCGEEASEEKVKKKDIKCHLRIKHVLTPSFKDSLTAAADNLWNYIAKTVMIKIIYEHDLVATEARSTMEVKLVRGGGTLQLG